MNRSLVQWPLAAWVTLAAISGLTAPAPDPLAIEITAPTPAETGYFKLGTARRPDGSSLGLDSISLFRDGRRWLPAMGGFDYARFPENAWREELLKMKSGGLDVVSTTVFWIVHEEAKGEFDWTGPRDLRRFIQTCAELNLQVIARCGPGCRGGVRNGGLPDWVANQREYKPRTEDPRFLELTTAFYAQIAQQLHGLLWKDGGPVIGIQLDSDYDGPASYLLALKAIAQNAGLDVPFYTRTGWPNLKTPMPPGEILPLYARYADGYWERSLLPAPRGNAPQFLFSNLRLDSVIGAEPSRKHPPLADLDVTKAPYLTCDIGSGMASSYHRRILSNPMDCLALTLVSLGSGNNLPGYSVYHGGCNPDAKLSTLNDSQTAGSSYDLPVKNYDFQAPLGEFGEFNPLYHLLRRVHLFLRDYGEDLAAMTAAFPSESSSKTAAANRVHWAVRSNGRSGYLFVNNYQRLQSSSPKTNVQFTLKLPGETLVLPDRPVTVPSDRSFFWPFNLDLGGVNLIYATAQPICRVSEQGIRTVFFATTPGVPAEFVFDATNKVIAPAGRLFKQGGRVSALHVSPGTQAAVRVECADGTKLQIVLLDDFISLALWKGEWAGRERVFLSHDALVFDGDTLRVIADKPDYLSVEMIPAPPSVLLQSNKLGVLRDGLFTRFNLPVLRLKTFKAEVEPLKPEGRLRKILLSKGKPAVALAPDDTDFSEAASWQIHLPENLNLMHDPLLRFYYLGDVARVTLNNRLIQDDFYNGNYFDLGLRPFEKELSGGDLRLAILPLQRDAPISLGKPARPDFGKAKSALQFKRVEVIHRCEADLTAGK